MDGKPSRASGVHLLNVFVTDAQQTIWQAEVDEKANEIAVLRAILPELFEKYPFLKILTGDALFAGIRCVPRSSSTGGIPFFR